MNRSVTVAVCLFFLLCGSVFAGPPVQGVYKSALGDMLEGRFSESWIGGGQGQEGNTVHALSYDGIDLGTNWKVLCPVLDGNPVLLEDTIDENGYGHRKYRTEYVGGKFWLDDGAGVWGGDDPDPFYDGTLTYYAHTTVMQFEAGQLVGYNTTAELRGYFDFYGENCMQLTIANAASDGIGGIPPAGYPVLTDGTTGMCEDADPGVIGEWGSVTAVTMFITSCTVSNEPASWGGIKSLYR